MVTFIPTPIGNLEDITLRTLKVLEDCEVLLCEDTRITQKLIELLAQRKLLNPKNYTYIPVHSHNEKAFLQETPLAFWEQKIAYLSDAGMPCISDPGVEIVRFLQKYELPYEVLGGISALTLAVAFSGMVEKEFLFLGFPPHKNKEKTIFIQTYCQQRFPFVLYESPHRLLETLEILAAFDKNRSIFLAKELSKKFQQTFKGEAGAILETLKSSEIKGEWVMIIEGREEENRTLSQEEIYALEIPPKIKAKILAKLHKKSASEFYNALCQSKL